MTFWSKCYDVIIFVHEFTYKTLSHDWNYIVDAVMRPKFGKSRISMREVSITLIFITDWPEQPIFLKGALGSSSIIWDWH